MEGLSSYGYNNFEFLCIFVDPTDEIFQVLNKLLEVPPYRHVILLLEPPKTKDKEDKWVLNQFNCAKLDKYGRIVLTNLRRNYGEEVYILGQGDRIEIWPLCEYKKRMSDIARLYADKNC